MSKILAFPHSIFFNSFFFFNSFASNRLTGNDANANAGQAVLLTAPKLILLARGRDKQRGARCPHLLPKALHWIF